MVILVMLCCVLPVLLLFFSEADYRSKKHGRRNAQVKELMLEHAASITGAVRIPLRWSVHGNIHA